MNKGTCDVNFLYQLGWATLPSYLVKGVSDELDIHISGL